MFHMYDKICISVTSHALDPLSHKLSHLLGPLPLERDVLYGRPLMSDYGMLNKIWVGGPNRYTICTFSPAFQTPSAEQNMYTDLESITTFTTNVLHWLPITGTDIVQTVGEHRPNAVFELSKCRWGVEIFCRWGSREEVGGSKFFSHTGLKRGGWGSNFVINYRRKSNI